MRGLELTSAVGIGLASIGLVAVAALLSATAPVTVLRERVTDLLLERPASPANSGAVAIVDIDRTSLAEVGAWPWTREQLADLIDAIASAKPSAVGLDILLAGADERSARALARQLAGATSDASVKSLALSLSDRLPDDDVRLAAALRRVPSVLGMVLDPQPEQPTPRAVPFLMRGRPDLRGLWQDEGAVGAGEVLGRAAAGHGVLLLPGDDDARIRRAPLLVATPNGLYPGLALEVARASSGASSYLVGSDPAVVQTGRLRLPLGHDGMLRLRPRSSGGQAHLTLSAITVLRSPDTRASLAGKPVLVGSSAPEVGGLRPGASGALVPSVVLHADALGQILAGDAPLRTRRGWVTEMAMAVTFAAFAMLAAARLAPLVAGLLALALAGAWGGLALGAARQWGVLLDPLLVPVVALAGYGLAVLATATRTRRREALIRRRFEQHLAPAVVARIVSEPGLLKLKGEAREVTAVFTDIEGFTSMTERAAPDELVALLDRYIDGASRIIVEHGGMVEKIVGDGLHALFNAPLDLADHPSHALAAALDLQAFSERLRLEPDAQRLGLGRTRIGIETGPVIVGDVGGGRKLDYTAYGNVMNRAARLEAANKELGSAIAVGPDAAARIGASRLRPLGEIRLRGVSEAMSVYEPWPKAFREADRERYRGAVSDLATAPARAMSLLARLADENPEDSALARLAERASQSVAE